MAAAGTAVQDSRCCQRLPVVELRGPVFQSAAQWQPGRSLEAAGATPQQTRARDLTQQQHHLQAGTARCVVLGGGRRQLPPALPQQLQHQQHQLHREASQITMATVAMERLRWQRESGAASSTMELDGRHLSALGQRRGAQPPPQPPSPTPPPPQSSGSAANAATTLTDEAAPPPPTSSSEFAGGVPLRRPHQQPPASLPFVRQHLRRHRTLLELSQGRDRLIVDPFAESPTPAERLAGRLRACCGEPTPGQARILEMQHQQQQQLQQDQQQRRRRRLSRREKTAQTISRAILTYDRSL